MAGKNFEAFKHTIEREFMGHPVVTRQRVHRVVLAWRHAAGSSASVHGAVLGVLEPVSAGRALNRVINADTLHAARESKEILMNELGVIYNSKRRQSVPAEPARIDVAASPTAIAKAIRRSSRPRARWTAASSGSRRRTSNGCFGSASRWA